MLSNSTTRLVDNYKERIAGTKATIFLRNGIFQINYYLGDGAYKSQSLKTSKLEEARQRARLLLAKYEYRISEGLPVHGRSLGVVIDEYLAERKKGLRDERGQPVYGSGGIKTHPQLWRHLQRVTRYFRQFAGSMSIERIGDGELSRYLAWRQELYTRVRAERDPNRAPRYIAEKTLLWELTLLKTILRWAQRVPPERLARKVQLDLLVLQVCSLLVLGRLPRATLSRQGNQRASTEFRQPASGYATHVWYLDHAAGAECGLARLSVVLERSIVGTS